MGMLVQLSLPLVVVSRVLCVFVVLPGLAMVLGWCLRWPRMWRVGRMMKRKVEVFRIGGLSLICRLGFELLPDNVDRLGLLSGERGPDRKESLPWQEQVHSRSQVKGEVGEQETGERM